MEGKQYAIWMCNAIFHLIQYRWKISATMGHYFLSMRMEKASDLDSTGELLSPRPSFCLHYWISKDAMDSSHVLFLTQCSTLKSYSAIWITACCMQ